MIGDNFFIFLTLTRELEITVDASNSLGSMGYITA